MTDEIKECIDYAYEKAKKIMAQWNDMSMQQIRLRSANEQRVEQSRQHHISEMDERKSLRYKAQKQANYEAWKNSPDYDPKKDRYNP